MTMKHTIDHRTTRSLIGLYLDKDVADDDMIAYALKMNDDAEISDWSPDGRIAVINLRIRLSLHQVIVHDRSQRGTLTTPVISA